MAKRSFLSRTGRYGINRIQPEVTREASKGTILGGYHAARKAFSPEKVDLQDLKAGLSGRYDDGGHQRFAEMVRAAGLTPEDLLALQARHRRSFALFLSMAIVFLVGAFLMILLGRGPFSLLGAAILLVFMCGALVMGLQADFSAYQIRKRAFCGLRSYLREGFFAR